MLNFLKPNSTASWAFYWMSIAVAFILIPLIVGWKLWDEIDYWDLWGTMVPFQWGLIFMIFWYSLYCADAIISYDKENGFRLRRVDTGQIGMLLFAGQPFLEVSHGFTIVLRGWFEIRVGPLPPSKHMVTIQRIETAAPDLVAYDKLGLDREAYKNDELHARMSVGVVFNIFSQLERGKYANYLTNVGSDQKFLELVPEIARGFVTEEFSIRTPAIINSQREEINRNLELKLKSEINKVNDPENSWGLKISKVQLVDIIFPDEVVDKMTEKVMTKMEKYIEVVGAQARGQITRIDARAERYKESQLGAGRADAERMMLDVKAVGQRLMHQANAIGYGRVSKALGIEHGEFVLQMETMKTVVNETMKNSDYTYIGSSDFANMFGFMSLLKNGLEKLGSGK